MTPVIIEDRTQESPEQSMHRQVAGPAQAIAAQAFGAAQGNPVVALHILAAALGQLMARTGADVEQVVEAVRRHHAAAEIMLAEARHASGRAYDA